MPGLAGSTLLWPEQAVEAVVHRFQLERLKAVEQIKGGFGAQRGGALLAAPAACSGSTSRSSVLWNSVVNQWSVATEAAAS